MCVILATQVRTLATCVVLFFSDDDLIAVNSFDTLAIQLWPDFWSLEHYLYIYVVFVLWIEESGA